MITGTGFLYARSSSQGDSVFTDRKSWYIEDLRDQLLSGLYGGQGIVNVTSGTQQEFYPSYMDQLLDAKKYTATDF